MDYQTIRKTIVQPAVGDVVYTHLPVVEHGVEVLQPLSLGLVTRRKDAHRVEVSFGLEGEHTINVANLTPMDVPAGLPLNFLGWDLAEFALTMADESLRLAQGIEACEAARQDAQTKLDALVAAELDAHRAPARLAKNGNGRQTN